MNRPAAHRVAFAIALAFTVGTMGATMAAPEFPPGGNPNVTLNVTPNDGDNLASPAPITVIGAGFGSNQSGDIVQCTFDATTQFEICSNPLGRFTSNAAGSFSQDVTVTSTFTGLDSQGQPVQVDCLQVACTVQAITDSGSFISQHHISFAGGGGTTTTSTSTSTTLAPTTTSTSTSTTLAPTTTSTSTSTTLAPTTTTSTSTSTTLAPTTSTSTSTTLPPTTPPANPLCSALLHLRSQVSATLDVLGSSLPAIRPFGAHVLALIDQFIALLGCGGNSPATAAAPPPAGLPTGTGLDIGDLLGATGLGPPAAGSEQAVTWEYVVAPGDSLFALSQRLLGDGDLYPTLFEMNQDEIADADLLTPGQVLRIPVGTG